MRDVRRVALEALDAILLFEDLAFEPQLVHVLRHVFKVNRGCRLIQIFDLLDSNGSVL